MKLFLKLERMQLLQLMLQNYPMKNRKNWEENLLRWILDLSLLCDVFELNGIQTKVQPILKVLRLLQTLSAVFKDKVLANDTV